MITNIQKLSLAILFCMATSATVPMQTEITSTLSEYAIPAAKIAAGVALIKYLGALQTKSSLLNKALGRTDIDYKSETISATTGRVQKFNLSIHCNMFPILAGLYLIKNGIQSLRNT